jgi:hypothetical protein
MSLHNFIQRAKFLEHLSATLVPLKEQYSNVDMFEQNFLEILELDLFYGDVAERNEWISDKKTHRPTYTPLTFVPGILFTVITDYIDTGCSTTELQTLMSGYDSNAAF